MSVGDGDCHTVKIDAGPSGGPDRLSPHRLARRVLALEPVGRAALSIPVIWHDRFLVALPRPGDLLLCAKGIGGDHFDSPGVLLPPYSPRANKIIVLCRRCVPAKSEHQHTTLRTWPEVRTLSSFSAAKKKTIHFKFPQRTCFDFQDALLMHTTLRT
jgi:hypothetical protein